MAGRLVVLAAALLLSVAGVSRLRALWLDLPVPSLKRIDWDAVRQARETTTGDAREGRILAIISNHFTTALHHPDRLHELLADARGGIRLLRRSQLGRLQVSALTLLHLERAGVPAEEWWLRLRLYLEGLDNASFAHFLPALLAADAAIYADQGLGPGTARGVALVNSGAAHGPFLQYFVARLRQLAAQRRQAGDHETADLCEQIVHRLLRQWILDPGPAGPRLLAAELLADSLEAQATPSASTSEATLARKLRRWRAAYTANAADIPLAPSVLRVVDAPTPVAAVGWSLARWIALAIWTATALIPVGLIAVATGAFWIKAGVPETGRRRYRLVAVWQAIFIVLIGWGVLVWSPELVHDDLLRIDDLRRAEDEANHFGLPYLPFVAAATALVVLLTVSLVGSRPEAKHPLMTKMACSAAVSWLTLSILLLVLTSVTDRFRRDYEVMLSHPGHEQLNKIADPNAEGLLDELRAWAP
ncbi:MAG: hypothetical protein KAY37_17035 [Phycisphaerae bacterium]|nr:hypothetical protein [Phycisphaerae bacterium]